MLLLSPVDEWPQVFSVSLGSTSASVRVYIWHLTHDLARGDYKFQLTGVSGNQFVFESGVRTIVLGYYEPLRVYLAADANHRRGKFGRSPAIQTRQSLLDSANADGFCAFTKARTSESAIVLRRDVMASYLVEAHSIHAVVAGTNGVQQLNAMTALVGNPSSVILKPRAKAATTVVRSIRSFDFSNRIMIAYQHACCVCDIQMDLLDAAHIVPVGAPLGSDDTRNGLALCTLHHKAYDAGLLGIKPDYSIEISSNQSSYLHGIARSGGLDMFKANLRSSIALPYNKADRPDPSCLQLGLGSRNWKQ